MQKLGVSNEEGACTLGGKDAAATIAVSDLQRAQDFYENALGLAPVQEQPGASCMEHGLSASADY